MATKRLICLIEIFVLVLSTISIAKMPKEAQNRLSVGRKNRTNQDNLSIVQISVEPTQFKVGDRVHVFVKIVNRGKIIENKVSVNLTVPSQGIDMAKNIAAIAPGEIVEVDFACIIGKRKSELIEVSALVETIAKEKRIRSKTKKVKYNYIYEADGDVGILYKVDQPVHQWIAFQAYKKLPEGPLKNEMSEYLPTSSSDSYYSPGFDTSGWTNNYDFFYISSLALIEGAWEEDKPFIEGRWMAHYWNPDGGYNDGLYIGFKSALQKAQEDLWQDAISAYNNDQPAQAYYLLGRIAHLLMDMSVPAHTLLDEHPIEDRYEEFTGDNYKNITSSSPNTGIPSGLPSYPQSTPPSYDDDLTKLFYNLAEKSDDFDSDDEDGESTDYGNGKYTWGRNALDASKTFSRAEYFVWTLFGWEKERDIVRYVDYDIFKSCINSNEYHIYYYWSFYDEYNNSLTHWVKVYYTDGSSEFVDWDLEELGGVPDSVLECIYQPRLEAWAIGYVAALYRLFWDSVEHPDTDPPTPSPMTWATEPYQTSTSSISMLATVASDPSTPIYYEFDFFTSPSGGSGGTDSGWQTSTSYTDSGLEPNHRYSYRVRAKDSATTPNVTAYSIFSDEYTDIETPSGITFGTITSTSIQVKSTNTPSGLDRGSSGLYISASTGQYSGWKQNNDYWTCTGLTPNYDTGFRIKARNGDGDETGYCTTVYKYTLANQPGPLPFSNITTNSIQVNWTSNGNYYYTDYYCENLTTGQNSGWVNNAYSWNNTGLSDGMSYTFRVKSRNSEGIETEWTDLGIAITPVAGSLQVTITPQGVVNAGAKWKLIGTGSPDENWKSSGQILPNIPVGSYTLQFKDISSFAEPPARVIQILQGTNAESGTYQPIYSGGTGIETDPYSISCTDDLLDMSDNPASWDKHFILTDNIDLAGHVFTTALIASDINDAWPFDGTLFTGIFDGNGHIVSNLNITGGVYLGLFGRTGASAAISNLGMENVNITGNSIEDFSLGGLVGWNDGIIDNCYATGFVTGGDYCESIGGLVGECGYYESIGSIVNSYAICSVSGGLSSSAIGGLVGDGSVITNCYAAGTVTGYGSIGGLTGTGSTITNSYFLDPNDGGGPDNGRGIPLTDEQMKQLASFVGWDFIDTWNICENMGYPKLLWQISPADMICPDGVTMIDFAFFAGYWLDDNCGYSNDCDGADLDFSNSVDSVDLKIFCDHWLEGTTP